MAYISQNAKDENFLNDIKQALDNNNLQALRKVLKDLEHDDVGRDRSRMQSPTDATASKQSLLHQAMDLGSDFFNPIAKAFGNAQTRVLAGLSYEITGETLLTRAVRLHNDYVSQDQKDEAKKIDGIINGIMRACVDYDTRQAAAFINQADANGNTPFLLAYAEGNYQAVDALISLAGRKAVNYWTWRLGGYEREESIVFKSPANMNAVFARHMQETNLGFFEKAGMVHQSMRGSLSFFAGSMAASAVGVIAYEHLMAGALMLATAPTAGLVGLALFAGIMLTSYIISRIQESSCCARDQEPMQQSSSLVPGTT